MLRIRFWLFVAAVAAPLVLVPAVHAGQPVTQALVPAPQPWLTCKAVGNGTICQGTHSHAYGPDPQGLFCGSGAAQFEISDQGVEEVRKTRYYDADGYLTRIVTQVRFVDAMWSNPLSGAVVPYTQRNTITDDLAVRGDLSTLTETNVGENIYRDPATNAIVSHNTGRTVIGPTGDVEFESGKQTILDFVTGDPNAFTQLCAVLAG